jgi:CO dehydrogenase maturation factor
MAYTIAFAGKGGTGKTSIAALTMKYLIYRRKGAVLGVDADSNSCLNEALGVEVHKTVGRLREESLDTARSGAARPGGMSLEQMFDYEIQQSVIEADGFDLLVMGRPEGPGCYCAANNIIRKYTDKLSESYSYVVLDNEAGMEHLSRLTTHKVDILFVVSDPTMKGIITAKRIVELVAELKIKADRCLLIINRVNGEDGESLKAKAEEAGITVAGLIPNDGMIARFDFEGKPLRQLPEDSVSVKTLFSILDTLDIP